MADALSHNAQLKRSRAIKRRQLELRVRADTSRSMYHDVLESVIELYKDERNSQHTWQHFRTAADKLAQMHKFMKLTLLKAYELGVVEGAASYSSEFFQKLDDCQFESSDSNIPFDFLCQYLSEPNDPPPRYLKRLKRLHNRRRFTYQHKLNDTIRQNLINPDLFQPNCPINATPSTTTATTTTTSTIRSSGLDSQLCDSKWIAIQQSADQRTGNESEGDCPSEDSLTSLSSCTCGGYATDSASSTNDDDDRDDKLTCQPYSTQSVMPIL